MILVSHIIISGLLGTQAQNYFLAALIGLASHFVLDWIPHWDNYLHPDFIKRAEEGAGFLKKSYFWEDMLKVAADIAIGLVLFLIFYKYFGFSNFLFSFAGIIFGVLLDPLQLLYLMTKWRPYRPMADFHRSLQKTKLSFWPGILIQFATIAAVLFAVLYL